MYRTWAKCVARYLWQASLFKALVLAICSGVGAGLVGGARCFFWAARRSRFRLKISSLIILAQALFDTQHDRGRTSWWLARHEGQSIAQGHAMALLPGTPNSQSGDQCRPNPPCP